jgi:DNA-directed RNA polymerase subunit beta'
MVKNIKFKNQIFSKKELKSVIYDAFTNYGIIRASALADELKSIGFHYATQAGLSISVEDLKIPPTKKDYLLEANQEILNSDLAYARGEITSVERFQKVIDIWNKTSETLKNKVVDYFRQTDPLNSIYLMAFSGARGNLSQVRQLVGMRGLMSDPNGQIIDIPIIHNFREGLTITDFIMSAYGARKGVVDTALRTADSGYLTRRLIDVAQDIIIREHDCQTKRSIRIYKKEVNSNFKDRIVGRTSAETIYKNDKTLLIAKNEQITKKIADDIISNEIKCLKINSPLTCESTRSICQKCYGWDLSKSKVINLGEAVGIIAAQSIGEPGTQLTMRTFHTGGIFTADASRQVRSKITGLFFLNSGVQTKTSRTLYGTKVDILEREASCNIIDFNNKTLNLKLPADSSIFIKNGHFVKSGDLIAELPIKNQQTIKSRKNIIANHSGELYFATNENLLWILEGSVYQIPNNSLFNNFLFQKELKLQDNLVYFKLKSKKSGVLKIINEKNKLKGNSETIKLAKSLYRFNLPIFWEQKLKKMVIQLNTNEYYVLNELPTILKKTSFTFAENFTKKYRTKTGGQIIYPDTSFVKYDSTFDNEVILKNGKILFIPAEIHNINKDKSLLLVQNKTKLTTPGTEIIKGIFSKTNGFLQIKEANQILQEIQIKPGDFFEYANLKEEDIENLKKLDKRLFFPGEVIFEDIIVNYLALVEITKSRNCYGLILRPIQEFNIPKPNNNLKTLSKDINFISVNRLKYSSNLKHNKKQGVELVDSSIWIKSKKQKVNLKTDFIFKLIPKREEKNEFNLAIMLEENLNIENCLSKQLNEESLKFSMLVKNLEYVEKNTVFCLISITTKNKLKLERITKQFDSSLKVLTFTETNYQTYCSEANSFLPKKNEMLKIGDLISPLVKTNYSGKVLELKPFKLKIHKSTPLFITPSTSLYKQSGSFIKKDEILAIINFEQIVTGDIVQGLPKIEEILEARKPQNPALLNESPGIITKFQSIKHLKINSITISGNKLTQNININPQAPLNRKRITSNLGSFIVKKNDFIFVGQALTEGSINPHNLLMTYFAYYKNFGNEYESAYLSFKNVQLLLIQKIQQVYGSQGVAIADKHLEVIVRRITSKIQITNPGSSFLLHEEIIELKQIEYINLILKKSFKKTAKYIPILLGITKASLLTDSFISAASFQETTKILTAAAIEGKIDWLRGLKENVIIGRLIPVGTGFLYENKK